MSGLIRNLSRRSFLAHGVGLTLAVRFGTLAAAESAPASAPPLPEVRWDAFVRIAPDNTVTVIAKHLEMGQGTFTGLATLVAEELDADWASVRVEGAPADAGRYGNLAWGGTVQGTGGSSAMAAAWQQMRQAGATARALLVTAAAADWKVPAREIRTEKGRLLHAASGRAASFGAFAEAAARLKVPTTVALKPAADWTLIGKEGVRRTDSAAKTDGSALFTQDVQLPGMAIAVLLHPPRFGAVPAQVQDAATRALPGVLAVFPVAPQAGVYQGGVAVLARDTWTAIRGRSLLQVEWDDTQAVRADSTALLAEYRALAERPGHVAVDQGSSAADFAAAARTLEAEYVVPYLAHASMEPLNCVVRLQDGGCEIWNGEQFHTIDQGAIAALLKVPAEAVQIHQVYAGGSFGRRANPKSDYLLEAVSTTVAAAAAGHAGPVKLVWTREDDMRGGYFRPLTLHRMKATLDAGNVLQAWWQRVVGQSIAKGSPFEPMMVRDGVDATTMEGVTDLPYQLSSLHAELHSPDPGVPVQWWRSVGHTHTGFAVEAFLDEIASAAQADPVAFRRTLLKAHPRHLGVLDLVADKAGWRGGALPSGPSGERRGRGIALRKSFDTHVAQIAEVCVFDDGRVHVERVVCAVDCGVAINPDVIRAQMEGGIGYGLSAALYGAITLKDGVVEQSNFHDYPVLRMHQMPVVETHIVPSSAAPTGVGEPGTAVIAPALVNAIHAATGVRIRSLPVDPALLRRAVSPGAAA